MGARIANSALLAVVALGVWLWTGCTPSPREAVAPAKTEEPKYGGIFQFAGVTPLDTLDPYFSSGVAVSISLRPIYETLLRYKQARPDEDYRRSYEVEPWLAERWEQPTLDTYIFYLRKGVRWHDGLEFTAEDMVFSFNRLVDPENKFAMRGRMASVNTLRALDKYTVLMSLKAPDPDALTIIADYTVIPILPKSISDKGQDYKKVAIGTGPFKLKSFDRTKGISVTRNEDYWDKGKPYIDGIRVIYGLDKSGMLAALKSRDNDYSVVTDKKQFDSIYAISPELQYSEYFGNTNAGFRFKMDRPPYNDIRVRKAFHLAIDRQEMVGGVGQGRAAINSPSIPMVREGWGIPTEELLRLPGWRQPKDQDIAEAKRLLTEAGYPTGFKTTFEFYTTRVQHPGIAEMAVGQLRKIGIEATAQGWDEPTCTKKYMDGSYEATMCGSPMFFQLNTYLPSDWHSKGPANKAGLADPELDRLIEAQGQEMDTEKRKKISQQIDRLFLEKVYYVPTIDLGLYAVWQPYVNNLFVNYTNQAWLISPADHWMDLEKMPKGRSLE